MTKREFAEFIFENLVWDNMEAVLYKDGFAWARQVGSWGTDEDEIIARVPLSFEYWSESWFFDDLYDYDTKTGERVEKEITNEDYKREIIDGIYTDIFHHGFYEVD